MSPNKRYKRNGDTLLCESPGFNSQYQKKTYKMDQVASNDLSFCLEKSLHTLQFSIIDMWKIKLLVSRVFSLSALSILFHYLLAIIIPGKDLSINLLEGSILCFIVFILLHLRHFSLYVSLASLLLCVVLEILSYLEFIKFHSYYFSIYVGVISHYLF